MENQTLVPTYCGQTQVPLGSRVKIVANKQGEPNDDCLIGLLGTATHPFAIGCTKPGWIGIRLYEFSAYGYTVNVHQTEVEIA